VGFEIEETLLSDISYQKITRLLAIVLGLVFLSCGEMPEHAHLLPETRGEAAAPFPREPLPLVNQPIITADSIDELFRLERVVKLESSNESILGHIQQVRYHDQRFYILDNIQKAIRVFDDHGGYLFSVGRRGEGPGEYLEPESIYIVDDRVAVVDSKRTQLIYYSLDGDLLEILVPDSSSFPIYFYGNMIFDNDLIYVCDFFSFDVEMPRHVVLDSRSKPARPIFGFGDRLPFYHTKIGRKTPQYLTNIFALVDDTIWTLPSYQTDLEIYDLGGHLLGILPSGVDGITKEAVSEIQNNRDFLATREMTSAFRFFRLGHHVFLYFELPFFFNVYDTHGNLIRKRLKPRSGAFMNAFSVLDGLLASKMSLSSPNPKALERSLGSELFDAFIDAGLDPADYLEDNPYLIFFRPSW
jgi:hypothetical protein